MGKSLVHTFREHILILWTVTVRIWPDLKHVLCSIRNAAPIKEFERELESRKDVQVRIAAVWLHSDPCLRSVYGGPLRSCLIIGALIHTI